MKNLKIKKIAVKTLNNETNLSHLSPLEYIDWWIKVLILNLNLNKGWSIVNASPAALLHTERKWKSTSLVYYCRICLVAYVFAYLSVYIKQSCPLSNITNHFIFLYKCANDDNCWYPHEYDYKNLLLKKIIISPWIWL